MIATAPLDGPARANDVIDVLCDGFADYPIMRYVLGDEGDYPARLRTLIGFFAGNRFLRNDAIIGVSVDGELRGVALCSLPDRVSPPEMDRLRERTWAALGPAAQARYDRCVEVWMPLGVAEPNVHLNMVAVPSRFQGQGLGRALLDRVHVLSRERDDSRGVTLTTELEANVALYRHVGYEVVGRGTIAPGLETWGMYRPDDQAT
ncbi:MAG TPA: GNAT family N-acetyltransferase [Gemmatimonadales bacterium]|nr:GNAT family N-acetyltransferase [Gemmatimonadales bacterium]